MSVFVPYVSGMLRTETRVWAMKRQGVRRIALSADDNTAYWKLLSTLWIEGQSKDLVIVEHDMLPAEGVVEEMLACHEPWCTSPYKVHNETINEGLGCVKFSKGLRHLHPDLMRVVGAIADDGLPAKDWRRMDVRIARVLRRWGYQPHTHKQSKHLHYET